MFGILWSGLGLFRALWRIGPKYRKFHINPRMYNLTMTLVPIEKSEKDYDIEIIFIIFTTKFC